MISALLSDLRVRFLIAGGSAALLNWLVRFPLSLVFPYTTALTAAQAIGMAYGFIIYRHWAFRSSGERPVITELRDFLAVNAAGATVTIVIAVVAKAGLMLLSIPPSLAEGVAHAGGITGGAIINFLGHKHVTFSASAGSRQT